MYTRELENRLEDCNYEFIFKKMEQLDYFA